MISLTLASTKMPVCSGLQSRSPARSNLPETIIRRPKWQIALDEIIRALASGARFGSVLADAAYGKAAVPV